MALQNGVANLTNEAESCYRAFSGLQRYNIKDTTITVGVNGRFRAMYDFVALSVSAGIKRAIRVRATLGRSES